MPSSFRQAIHATEKPYLYWRMIHKNYTNARLAVSEIHNNLRVYSAGSVLGRAIHSLPVWVRGVSADTPQFVYQ